MARRCDPAGRTYIWERLPRPIEPPALMNVTAAPARKILTRARFGGDPTGTAVAPATCAAAQVARESHEAGPPFAPQILDLKAQRLCEQSSEMARLGLSGRAVSTTEATPSSRLN